MRDQQGSIEGWTAFVFLGLALAAVLGAAAARIPQFKEYLSGFAGAPDSSKWPSG